MIMAASSKSPANSTGHLVSFPSFADMDSLSRDVVSIPLSDMSALELCNEFAAEPTSSLFQPLIDAKKLACFSDKKPKTRLPFARVELQGAPSVEIIMN